MVYQGVVRSILHFAIEFARLVGGAILMLFGFRVMMKPPGGMPYIQIAGLAGGLLGLVLILNPGRRFSYHRTDRDDHSKH